MDKGKKILEQASLIGGVEESSLAFSIRILELRQIVFVGCKVTIKQVWKTQDGFYFLKNLQLCP